MNPHCEPKEKKFLEEASKAILKPEAPRAESLSKEATDLLQKPSIDSQTKTLEVPEPTKKKHGLVSSGDVANVPVASCERSTPPLLLDYMDPNMCYLPNGYVSFYYGGELIMNINYMSGA